MGRKRLRESGDQSASDQVSGNSHGGSGSGTYTVGTIVTIKANTPPSGYAFNGWTATANSGGRLRQHHHLCDARP